jgi:hypothetical protein
MGDSQNDIVRVEFDRKIKLEFHGSTVTSAGPKLLRLLEQEGYRYAIRLKTNPMLECKTVPLLKRLVEWVQAATGRVAAAFYGENPCKRIFGPIAFRR